MHRWLCLWIILAIHGTVTAGIWMDVPFVRQPENGCGAAVASMVLQYWTDRGYPSTLSTEVEDIKAAIYLEEQKGIAASAMKEYFRAAGYDVFAFTGDLELLEVHLKQGRPMIVYLENRGGRSFRHYVVVVGLDRESGYILVNDPAERKLKKISLSIFKRQWETANHWTLLALPAAGR